MEILVLVSIIQCMWKADKPALYYRYHHHLPVFTEQARQVDKFIVISISIWFIKFVHNLDTVASAVTATVIERTVPDHPSVSLRSHTVTSAVRTPSTALSRAAGLY